MKHTREMGNELILGAKVSNVDLLADGHKVSYIKDGEEHTVTCRGCRCFRAFEYARSCNSRNLWNTIPMRCGGG